MSTRGAVHTGSEAGCYHCGLPVPANSDFSVVIDGARRAMCCPGCEAVASAIIDGGLERFYRYRNTPSAKPDEDGSEPLACYDLPEVQEDFVQPAPDGGLAVDLAITGITCAACAWLIEHHLGRLDGVRSVAVNVSTHRGRVVWEPQRISLSRILGAFAAIGYGARPADDAAAEKSRVRENRLFLLRLGVAGLAMMQAHNAALGLYFGAYSSIDREWEILLRWASMMITVPVVLFSAQPFFAAAWRSIRHRHLVMDVPVSLAIGIAFAASVWATLTESGDVYFDCVTMFTFFLLLGRYLEMRVRYRNQYLAGGTRRLIPPVAVRLDDDGEMLVPVKSLRAGDRIRVDAGATIPCDGEVVRGSSAVIEAVLTGEQLPVAKGPGSAVSAGTITVDHPLDVIVHQVGAGTRLGAILDMVDSAGASRPQRSAVADRVVNWFVAIVLVVAVAVFGGWWLVAPERALWVTLSVLVVTCPCALALATPTALTVATGMLRRRGFLIRRGEVLETLARATTAVLDKTGTLTLGNMHISDVRPLGNLSEQQVVALAAALEKGSTHPIARAFAACEGPLPDVELQRFTVGQGVEAEYRGEVCRFGKPGFAMALSGQPLPPWPEDAGQWLLLANGAGALGWIAVEDVLRPGLGTAISRLREKGLKIELLSGDHAGNVSRVAEQLGISEWRSDASPEDKLARIRHLQSEGEVVLMVGDGINDVPVLSGSDVSVAMGDAVDITRLHADSLLMSGNLNTLAEAVTVARRTRGIIRQNHAWAIGYNLVALPLAAAGLVPPWLAAIGMSVSSLLVVLNALRLGRLERMVARSDAKPAEAVLASGMGH